MKILLMKPVTERLKKEIPSNRAESPGGKLEVEWNRKLVMREATIWDK
jgi:hypothetical protein